ncbi:hypothetical protein [Streptomyces sp. NPDC050535]|uniref:hypothetical protein n=1 Tax=Streptomyces sp. NPDC050535 TaxID=3365626 RepID=UPI0037BAD8E7
MDAPEVNRFKRGLGHVEGRTWRGRHHHATLVTAAQAFLALRRMGGAEPLMPATDGPGRPWRDRRQVSGSPGELRSQGSRGPPPDPEATRG